MLQEVQKARGRMVSDRLGAGQGPDHTGLLGHGKEFGFILLQLGAVRCF